ncbi:cryptochrome/photolyase family protein [Neisseria weaveri]|uniref:cryptochrome/photolyase family protein n=1 Tax=Neisseria weaveri TaxID=28091 RepID=UPI0007C9C8A6|nr:deoxyribodipyrimidine photo-lyase [Neisseria weaveri]SAY51717.1 deoxyribodopyrimidine photolyase [Neisseria weaveri]
MSAPITLVWFRNDLRLEDNTVLQSALTLGLPVVGVFVFDNAVEPHAAANHRRQSFIYDSVLKFQTALSQKNIPLWILHGDTLRQLTELAGKLNAAHLVSGEDYHPNITALGERLWHALNHSNRTYTRVSDHVVLPKAAVMTPQGRPYHAFSHYKKSWLQTYAQRYRNGQPRTDWHTLAELQKRLPETATQLPPVPMPSEIGFQYCNYPLPAGEAAAQKQLDHFIGQISSYHLTRDFPAKKGTSQLAAYLNQGMLSARSLAHRVASISNEGAEKWLEELIWREFYQQILYHNPDVVHQSFRPEYHHLHWENREDWFERWKNGETGYPIVDAAMRQLKACGMMHNRLRMITAGFLVKDLLIDWRLGEAWFAEQLLDYDLAANNGNWQWSAGTGCDAQPYFRIFNPVLQSQKFDPDGLYIRRHLPELAHLSKDVIHAPWLAKDSIDTHGYPAPMVDHRTQREKALAMFKLS